MLEERENKAEKPFQIFISFNSRTINRSVGSVLEFRQMSPKIIKNL